jgi:hypothetical protein
MPRSPCPTCGKRKYIQIRLPPGEAFEKSRKEILDWQMAHPRHALGYAAYIRYLQVKNLGLVERIKAHGYACNEDGTKDCVSPCPLDTRCPYHINVRARRSKTVRAGGGR